MIPPPTASADPTEHADWLELAAISAPDSDCSGQDLLSAIKRTGSSDALDDAEDYDEDQPLDEPVEQENERLERIADAAYSQIELRAHYLGNRYPFSVNGSLKAKPEATTSVYAFLTAVTSIGWRNENANESATSLFERISARALVCYLGGTNTARAYDFGFPRHENPSSFYDAVEELCEDMGEGLGCKVSKSETSHVKDSKLDLAVWIPFGDDRPNQFSVFGQCSTGSDWQGKVNELLPSTFCQLWFKELPAVPPILAFFVPRQIEERYWQQTALGGYRLIFDRLRIAHCVGDLDSQLADRCASWTMSALK